MEAENRRQHVLRLHFNRESARWAKIKKEAEIAYQKWLHPILTKMASEADQEAFDLVCDKVNLRNSIHDKVKLRDSMYMKNRENASMTGNGNTGK